MSRKYYAERAGTKLEPLDFQSLKRLFVLKFELLQKEFYFREATGYKCTDEGDHTWNMGK